MTAAESPKSPQFEEIRNWVLSHAKARPETLLAALVGNAVALAGALRISRTTFLATVALSWDDTERRAKERG